MLESYGFVKQTAHSIGTAVKDIFVRGSIPIRGMDLFQCVYTGTVAHLPCQSINIGVSFPQIKATGA
jgi:hypothetical protein